MTNLIKKMNATPVIGNAFDDRGLWEICDQVAADKSLTLEERVSALVKMNELIGEDNPCTPEALDAYLIDTQLDDETLDCLMKSNEPCRAVITQLHGKEAASDIEKFGEKRWEAIWDIVTERFDTYRRFQMYLADNRRRNEKRMQGENQ